MSKLAPLNAKIEYIEDRGKLCVRKTYLHEYTSQEEYYAYTEVDKLIKKDEPIRMAQVFTVCDIDNSLVIEYVDGMDLYESIKKNGPDDIANFYSSLLKLFWDARKAGIKFDSDPSNFINNREENSLVIIDPVCKNQNLEDYAAVVFLWGLIKIMIRNWRIWQSLRLFPVWKRFYRDYCEGVSQSKHVLNQQMAKYIEAVISWNKKDNDVEGFIIKAIRRYIINSIYFTIKMAFKKNLVS